MFCKSGVLAPSLFLWYGPTHLQLWEECIVILIGREHDVHKEHQAAALIASWSHFAFDATQHVHITGMSHLLFHLDSSCPAGYNVHNTQQNHPPQLLPPPTAIITLTIFHDHSALLKALQLGNCASLDLVYMCLVPL